MIVTMDAKRRLTLPVGLTEAAPGDCFDVQFDSEEDAVVFRRLPKPEDWFQVLSECPEPMDDVPPRRQAKPLKRTL
jgi:hypothetical protein